MRVIITEKLSVTHVLAKVAGDFYPHEEIFFIEALPYWLNNFKFPKGMALSEYPYFGQPLYKRDQPWGSLRRRLSKLIDRKAVLINPISLDEAAAFMLTADDIICACDWDHTGIWGFDLFMEQTLGASKAPAYPVLVLSGGQDNKSLCTAFKTMIDTDHPEYQALLSAGKAKRLFEFSYAVNSQAILGNLYRRLAGTSEPVFVSKYALQALIWLAGHPPILCYKLEELMANKWLGTGKYPKDSMNHLFGMGSAASRQDLHACLTELGLINQSEKGMLSITPLGTAFVGALHPDCRDFDLPFRLDAWMSMGVEAAEPAIKRYMNTFFGKQMRFDRVKGSATR
ncbi:hypothetical protein RBE51_17645 [Pseudomonas taiwanensis]|uniref:hypothetical protein n=1 Tax=Pseudomonas taiwanensis TaxID=470150 RepID=UPI0028DD5DC1|nr:hypothetical protein [Pseudomonas taiwanensis]MDT8924634.1 hypothetical protein [Pseudomonas taiwanensis]